MSRLTEFSQVDFLEDRRNRWVPCKGTMPLIRWSNGCLSRASAKAWPKSDNVAENLMGCCLIVIDVDADHGGSVNEELSREFEELAEHTHCISKPRVDGVMPSYHLTYRTDRLIPTQHYRNAHVDIVGNAGPSLRFWKKKIWNGHEPKWLDEETWDKVMSYVERKENEANDHGRVHQDDGQQQARHQG